MKVDQKSRQDGKWFELMKLGHRCPSAVNGITIMGPTAACPLVPGPSRRQRNSLDHRQQLHPHEGGRVLP
jgi:hypothetical protein